MKIVTIIARNLLGLIFTVFGLNGFLHFIPMPPPQGLAAQFFGALYVSNYLVAIFAFQLVAGVLLLTNRFVPLALAILAPIVVNIALFHATMAPQGAGPAVLAIALWAVLVYRYRSAFAGLFAVKAAV